MKGKSKRRLSILFALVMMAISILSSMPLTASALNANELKTVIDGFNPGGNSTGSLTATVSPSLVTVTGTIKNVTNTLNLDIGLGMRVLWKANYEGTAGPLIRLSGNGTLEVATGGVITNVGNYDAIGVFGSSTVMVNGGEVSTVGTERSAIYTNAAYSSITVNSGTVKAMGAFVEKGYGICVGTAGVNSTINVTGGTVLAAGPNGDAIYTRGNNTIINIDDDATVSAAGTNGRGIFSTGEKVKVNIGGGTVRSGKSDAVQTTGVDATIKVSGSAQVRSDSLRAINAQGANSIVEVDGGTITSLVETAIWAPGANSSVTVTDGTISAGGPLVTVSVSNGKFTMSGGIVSNTGTGDAVRNSNADISGGTISSSALSALYANSNNAVILISGGTLEATGPDSGHAVYASGTGGTITISGGKLVNFGKLSTVRTAGTGPTVSISGGFVFGYGQAISGEENVIHIASGTPAITGTAVICAWDKNAGHTVYGEDSTDDLSVSPTAASAKWGVDGDGIQHGVRYANGTNTGFFRINGVTVNDTSVAPTITGTSTMTLAQGYAATSTGVYTITGDPAPTVTKTSGDSKITWDDTTNKLDIATGLTPGSYQVTLKAANGILPDATFTFTLTVTASVASFPFTDVPATAWYYDDVMIAWEQDLINGKTATLFVPNDDLTYAEAVKLAACMHQLYTTGSVTLANSTDPIPWYMNYVTYAKNNGIINRDYVWNDSATRAGYMEIFASALPDSAFNQINMIGYIPDVPVTHPQAAAIYKLYRAGIVQGVDAAHNCEPDSNIKRSEVAAILTRMMNETTRKSFST